MMNVQRLGALMATVAVVGASFLSGISAWADAEFDGLHNFSTYDGLDFYMPFNGSDEHQPDNSRLVGVKGQFVDSATIDSQVWDSDAILAWLNEEREKAYEEGLTDGVRPEPLQWSQRLKREAQIRAVEANLYGDHRRPSDTGAFTVGLGNGDRQGENLSWGGNYYINVLLWVNEKEDFKKKRACEAGDKTQCDYAQTGHYENVINPRYKSIGLAQFNVDRRGDDAVQSYGNSMAGRFSSFAPQSYDELAPVDEKLYHGVYVVKDGVINEHSDGRAQFDQTKVIGGMGSVFGGTPRIWLPELLYPQEYVVNFEPGAGSGVMDEVTGNKNTQFTLPSSEFTAPYGYEFEGWLIDGKTYRAGDVVTLQSDMTATAQYKPVTITITYDSAGGSPVVPLSVTYGTSVDELPSVNRECYEFAGWYTSDGEQIRSPYTPDARDVTLYAHWDIKKYRVEFTAGEGSGSPFSEVYECGAYVTLPNVEDCGFAPQEGYVFRSWDVPGRPPTGPGAIFPVRQDYNVRALWKLENVPVVSVDIVGGSSAEVGKILELEARVSPADATHTGVTWSSSDTEIAEVDYMSNYTGGVVGKKPGTVTITATAQDGSGVSASLTVTVKANVTPTPEPTDLPSGELVAVHRLFLGQGAGRHLYSTSAREIEVLKESGWKDEGIAFYTPELSGDPVHRLYNPVTGKHHYVSQSQGANEIKVLTSTGWKDDGVLFYADDEQGVALTRLYHQGANKHLHTADQNEIGVLTRPGGGWVSNGVSFYVAKIG